MQEDKIMKNRVEQGYSIPDRIPVLNFFCVKLQGLPWFAYFFFKNSILRKNTLDH